MEIVAHAVSGRSVTVPAENNVHFSEERDHAPAPVLLALWHALYRRKWIVIGAIAAGAIVAAILTIMATPQYVASAKLEISRESDDITGVEGSIEQKSAVDQEFYATQYGLLRSRSLARSVAKELKLGDDEAFRSMFGLKSPSDLLNDGKAPTAGIGERANRLDEAEKVLLEHVEVSPAPDSRLVDLRFSSPDPAFSAHIANVWVEKFIRSSLERRFDSASYARTFLEGQIENTRKRLEDAERKLVAYASAQGIVSINSMGSGSDGAQDQSLASNNLALLNAELAEATADRVRAESRVAQTGARGASAEALSNQAISTLRQRREEAAAEYAKLMVEFEPEYPRARALMSQIDSLDKAIAREESRVRGSLQEEYRAAVQRENSLRDRVAQFKGDVLDLRRRSIQYNILKRDVDTSRTLYEGLLQRYKEIGIAGGVGKSNVAVVDSATAPKQPSSPKPLINLLLGLLAGAIVGVGLGLGIEQLDEAVREPEDLPRKLGIPLLGAIVKDKDGDPVAALLDPWSPIAEGYVAVTTNLRFSTPHGVPRSIAVTSTRASEGKSTTALAIAANLARMGKRVLIIDADMRSPSLQRHIAVKRNDGLSSILSGNGGLEEVVQSTETPRLSAILAGPPPPNPAELLAGGKLELLLKQTLDRFDHVILDAPPVLGLADAPLIGSFAEAVLFVIEARGPRSRAVGRAIERLHRTRSWVLGGVLTKFEPKHANAGYGYGEEYGYGYGKNLPVKAA